MNDKISPCTVCGRTDCDAWQNTPKYPAKVEAVLMAAKKWKIAYTSEGSIPIETIFAARDTLIATVRDLEESEAKDG